MRLSADIFRKLNKHWQGNDKGMSRLGYSVGEEEAIQIVTSDPAVKSLGMRHFRDAAGNNYLLYRGASETNGVIMAGSHLDAVPNGGRYDGPSGVLSAIEAIKTLHESGTIPHHSICVPIFRCEEGPAFRHATLGSTLAVGKAGNDILDRTQTYNGETLKMHMTSLGIDTALLQTRLQKNQPLIPLGNIACAVEQHIEQSTTLVNAKVDVGIVTTLRGYLNFPAGITFTGQSNHTGTALQGKRRDPVRAAGTFISDISDRLDDMRSQGEDILFSFPVINTNDLASTCRIANECRLYMEVRSDNIESLRTAKSSIHHALPGIARQFNNMRISAGEPALMPPTKMSPDMVARLKAASAAAGIPCIETISGAVHDTGTLSREGIPATMILTRHGAHNYGQSHWPGEVMGIDDKADPFDPNGPYAAGIKVLTQFFATAHFPGGERSGNFAECLVRDYSGLELSR